MYSSSSVGASGQFARHIRATGSLSQCGQVSLYGSATTAPPSEVERVSVALAKSERVFVRFAGFLAVCVQAFLLPLRRLALAAVERPCATATCVLHMYGERTARRLDDASLARTHRREPSRLGMLPSVVLRLAHDFDGAVRDEHGCEPE